MDSPLVLHIALPAALLPSLLWRFLGLLQLIEEVNWFLNRFGSDSPTAVQSHWGPNEASDTYHDHHPLKEGHLTPHQPSVFNAWQMYQMGMSKLCLLSIYELDLDPHPPVHFAGPFGPDRIHWGVGVQVELVNSEQTNLGRGVRDTPI